MMTLNQKSADRIQTFVSDHKLQKKGERSYGLNPNMIVGDLNDLSVLEDPLHTIHGQKWKFEFEL